MEISNNTKEKEISFRDILVKLYKEQPYNDEGNRCDPATIFLIITEWDKFHSNKSN